MTMSISSSAVSYTHLDVYKRQGLRSALCAKLERLPAAYFTHHAPAKITSRFVNDVDVVDSLFTNGIISIDVYKRQGEKLVCVLSLGYGATQGVSHSSKPMESLCSVNGNMPEWFKQGMDAAMLAPTATNQQKFLITYVGDEAVLAKSLGGFYSKVDLGIVKYHFEAGAKSHSFSWR